MNPDDKEAAKLEIKELKSKLASSNSNRSQMWESILDPDGGITGEQIETLAGLTEKIENNAIASALAIFAVEASCRKMERDLEIKELELSLYFEDDE